MSWTTIATAVTGAVIPASFWNQQIVGNLAQSETSVITALGDFPYATGANSVSANTGVSFAKFRVTGVNTDGVSVTYHVYGLYAYIYTISAQTLNASTDNIVLTFDTAYQDPNSMSNLGVHNERLTCNVAGLYLIMGGLGTFSAGTNIALHLNKYNSSDVLQDIYANMAGITEDGYSVTCLVPLAVGDYVKLIVDNSLGSSFSTNTSTTDDIASKYLSAKRLSS